MYNIGILKYQMATYDKCMHTLCSLGTTYIYTEHMYCAYYVAAAVLNGYSAIGLL